VSSSTFSFKRIAAYAALPLPIRLWHLVIGLALALVYLGCLILLKAVYPAPRPNPTEWAFPLLSEKTEAIFIGTSHTRFGLDPRLFSNAVVNLSSGALDYQCMELILRRALRKAPCVKAVCIEAEVYPLRVDAIATYQGDLRPLYGLGLRLWELPRNVYWKLNQALHENPLTAPIFYRDRLTPAAWAWYGRPGEAKRDDMPANAYRVVAGYQPTDFVINERTDGRINLQNHQVTLRYNQYDRNLAALLRLAASLKAAGVRIVLIRYPLHRTYWLNRPAEWAQQYADMLQALAQALGPHGFEYWDLERSPEFQDADFADGHHLNSAGAARLAKLLDGRLQQIVADGKGGWQR